MLSALCLCAGIGGIEVGLSVVCDIDPACFVESDPYCQKVLKARYPDACIWDDVTTFPAHNWRGVDLVTAGFPCQPWSVAGARKGTSDGRWLWPRIAEIIRVVGPRYVWLENVCGLLVGGLGPVLGDLAALGFNAEWGVFSCAGMGAPQRRERVFVLAYRDDCERALLRTGEPEIGRVNRILANPNRADLREQPVTLAGGSGASESGRIGEDVGKPEHPESLQRGQGREASGERPGRPVRANEALAHPDQQRLEERPSPGRDGTEELAPPVGGGPELANAEGQGGRRIPDEPGQIDSDPRWADYAIWPPGPEGDWGSIAPGFWPVESKVCRVASGVSDRMERSDRRARLKALGNSVSPPVAAAAWVELWRRIR